MNTKREYLLYQAGLTADGVELGPYEMECIERLIDLTIVECGIALCPMLRDMISRGQAYELIVNHFKDKNAGSAGSV